MKVLDLDERKAFSLSILQSIDKVCRKHKINYFLAYGTLLGAVRHKGFIPWDDDIDIWILWEDLEKLILAIKEETDYEIINFLMKDEYPILFTKISDSRTLVERVSKDDGDFRRGIAVDVFPMFPYKNSVFDRMRQKMLFSLVKIFSIYRRQKAVQNLSLRGQVIRVGCRFLSAIKLDGLMWYKKLLNFLSKDAGTGLVFCPFSPYRNIDIHSINCFSNQCILEFEKNEFYAPSNYEDVLNKLYGNFMELPPVEKRIPNHSTIAYFL